MGDSPAEAEEGFSLLLSAPILSHVTAGKQASQILALALQIRRENKLSLAMFKSP